jgi:curved DNA-binding protein CbpA
MTTIYATLGVQPDATLDDIKRAYRRAAMKWHPDRNPGREAEAYAAFQEIREAYAILSDAEQRRVYDAVFAQEMQRWEAEREAQEAEERAAQRERERIAQEHYEKMVAVAMRFADDGHIRDVLFGVLLGRDCDAELAARKAAWQPPKRPFERGFGVMHQLHVTQANKGCDFDFLEEPVNPGAPQSQAQDA